MVSLFYPIQDDDFLLLMGLSGFFEHYFPELNECLIGTWQSQNDTLTLYPLYVQCFNKNGEMENVRETWNGAGVRFITKGYTLKLTDDSIRQHTGYQFHKEYGRRKQKGFPPRKREFERYY
jgi:hypothetical protein